MATVIHTISRAQVRKGIERLYRRSNDPVVSADIALELRWSGMMLEYLLDQCAGTNPDDTVVVLELLHPREMR